MRIVSLEPYVTDIVVQLGLSEMLVGVTHQCQETHALSGAQVVTRPLSPDENLKEMPARVGSFFALFDKVKALKPTHVLLGLPLSDRPSFDVIGSSDTTALLEEIHHFLADSSGAGPLVHTYAPSTLHQIFETFEQLGKDLGCKEKARDFAQRMRAQIMDWGDNFYDRMKNKRVTILFGVAPLKLAGRWIPDMINLASCLSQEPVAGGPHREVAWSDIVQFRPDVLLIAPLGMSHDQSLATFKVLEKIPNWESVPAVKRGEVFFFQGEHLLHRPGPSLLDGMGVLVSSIAGIESGYITKRDSFVRLRYLEMQRHRF